MDFISDVFKYGSAMVLIAFFCGVGFTAGAKLAFKNFDGVVVVLNKDEAP